ncbi:hypothetical protein N657DRAFT_636853 [Parathielavia appendiculata]|uniref:Heterokaryon incompatibility domain-containing protein n=1 Tax=Parathielavia appendiculata TaxID=2587402 RepID=A0AAN6TTP0_9PEZI|nr:hypothetical protein N657DRAFT_636853 [Parathielavia appendiculata]
MDPQRLAFRRTKKQSLQIVVCDTLNVSSMDSLFAILQQPASTFVQVNPGKFVQFTPASLCPVCLNLDPFQVPPQHNRERRDRPWARFEFKVPHDTPVVHFQIDKGTGLVESSQVLGVASDNFPHAGSYESFHFMKEQVENCMENHQCSLAALLTRLLYRVIWLKLPHTASGTQLIEPQGSVQVPYIALSYCWGPVPPATFLTNEDILAVRKAGIDYHDLPPLFQDDVTISRGLSFQYLWIDRTQDGRHLRRRHHNSCLASATTENDCILTPRDAKWEPMTLEISANNLRKLRFSMRHRSHRLGSESRGGGYERMLSTRTNFTQSALKFGCDAHPVWEGFGPGVTGHSWGAQLENITHQRGITNAADRRPAMDAVTTRIMRIKGWKSIREHALIEDPCWVADATSDRLKVPCKMHDDFYAPTWSWLELSNPFHSPMPELQAKDFNCQLAVLTVEGRVITREMNCEVKEKEDAPEEPGGEKSLISAYFMLGLEVTGPMPMTADVNLKPWTGLVHGQPYSTVFQSPYSERTSWISNRLCLLEAGRS